MNPLRTPHPQIVLLNVEPPGTDGIEWLQQLVSGLRESKVVILTDITRAECLKESFAAGARGLLSKSASMEELVASLVYVASGGTVFSRELIDLWLSNGPETGERWREDQPVLTAQELEILENLAQGLPDKEIVQMRIGVGPQHVLRHEGIAPIRLSFPLLTPIF